MNLDEQIKDKLGKIQQLRDQTALRLGELDALLIQKAHTLCPLPLGTQVEYIKGKFGIVDEIKPHYDDEGEVDLKKGVIWTVMGRKINKTGEYGVKPFGPIGPATHHVKGALFKLKPVK